MMVNPPRVLCEGSGGVKDKGEDRDPVEVEPN